MSDAATATPETDDPLTQAVRRAVRQPRVLELVAQSLEQHILEQFARDLGGAPVYVSRRGGKGALQERNRRIEAGFDGRNYEQLARAEGLTPRQVRNILTRQRKK